MFFARLRKAIEQKRNSPMFFWQILVWLKDSTWHFYDCFSKILIKIKFYPILWSVLATPISHCDKGGKAEVHSLVCHKHLKMYLLAIKSFIRFYDKITVVVHDDGTLTNKDKNILKKHIRGIKIIDLTAADSKVLPRLEKFPKAYSFRKNHLIAKQLFDYPLLADSDKIISLDSDTLFLKRPKELINWIESDNQEIICSYEKNPHRQKETLSKIGYNYQPSVCVGFLCFFKDLLDLGLIEELLSKMAEWDWWTTQNIYPVLIKQAARNCKISYFDHNHYQSWCDFDYCDPIFRHYWSSSGINHYYIKDMQKVVNNLRHPNR